MIERGFVLGDIDLDYVSQHSQHSHPLKTVKPGFILLQTHSDEPIFLTRS